MRYKWKVVHQRVEVLEQALNNLEDEGFEVVWVKATADVPTTYAIIGRKPRDVDQGASAARPVGVPRLD